jgi:putative transposase
MRYRRADVAGATYFFTVNLLNRKQTLLTDHIDLLKPHFAKLNSPPLFFNIDVILLLPEHLHTI